MTSLITIARYSKFGFNQLRYCSFSSFQNFSPYCLAHSRKKLFPDSYCVKSFSDIRNGDKTGEPKEVRNVEIIGSVTDSGKYQPFKDDNASIILDVIEERQRIEDLEETERFDEFSGLNLERGVTGVFDIEDLVDVLRRENSENIFVAALPPHLQYVDYIVVVSGKSLKHMLGLAEFIRRLYKKKRRKDDRIPRIEGETSKDWLAIDLGNIALHILSKSARPVYDIETLWAVGKEYDEKANSFDDPLAEILKKHAVSLDDFQPSDSLK